MQLHHPHTTRAAVQRPLPRCQPRQLRDVQKHCVKSLPESRHDLSFVPPCRLQVASTSFATEYKSLCYPPSKLFQKGGKYSVDSSTHCSRKPKRPDPSTTFVAMALLRSLIGYLHSCRCSRCQDSDLAELHVLAGHLRVDLRLSCGKYLWLHTKDAVGPA
jgi:hypothetical protein